MPWSKLTYNENLGGFQIDITKDELEEAPRYNADTEYDWSDDNNRRIYNYYGARPYW